MGEIKKYTEREGKPYPDALIWNPSGESALSAYIDLKRMDSDPHYNWLVYYGMLNPTWNGIILPEGKTLSWRQLAECMKKDHFRAAPEVEIIADMTEMAGERCPLMRLPMTEPGYVMTIINPRYRKDSIYQKLEDHILSDYGLIMLDTLKASVARGMFERSGRLPYGGGAEVRNVSFDNFYFHRTDNPDITQGDVIIHADLTFAFESEGKISELKNVRLRMEVEYNSVSNGLIIDKKIYTSYYGKRSSRQLVNQHLLPILKSDEDCEREAEEFLRKFYREGLADTPIPFDAGLVARRMGTDVRKADLSDRGSRVYGVFFPEGRRDVVIDEVGKRVETDLPDNTILYDVSIENDEVKLSDTIAHECVHNYKDRQFFFLQKHFGHQIGCFCYSPGKKHDQDALGQAERQVSRLVPRIKMPRKQFVRKADELITANGMEGYMDWQVYEKTIEQLASFFIVSKEAARIRMVELGFEQARGVSRFVDGRYIPSFSWTPGSIEKNQTFTISFAEGMEEYKRNPAFRALLSTGAFVYVDAHYCLNDARYVYRDRTGFHMTEEARRRMDRCCLVFDISYSRTPFRYSHGVFYNEARKSSRSAALDESAKALVASFGKGLTGTISRRQLLPGTYCGRLQYFRENRGYSLEKMEELTGISYKTIERYELNRNAVKKEAYMVALCLALELTPSESYDLLELAGLKLRDQDCHSLFAYVIDTGSSYTLGEINWLLKENKQPPLTKLIVPVDMKGKRRNE